MNIFVGNLSFKTTDEGMRQLFEQYGAVSSSKVIRSHENGQSRGFGFVEMPNPEEAKAAISALDGFAFEGRPLKVNEARPKAEKSGFRN
jgi:RNA recognition motif-containing protein